MSNEIEILDSMFGAFGQSVEEQANPEQETSGSKLKQFKPDPTKSSSGKWTGVVKFLPNFEDLKNPLIKKTTYWLTDPTTNKGFLYESPKSLDRFADCVVSSKYHEWNKSGDARLEKLAKDLPYSRKCFALIQVVRDTQNPENNGEIYLWNLPVKIQKLIDAKRFPSKEDIDLGEVAHNPFDPFEGLTMVLKIGTNDYGRVWDECQWAKEAAPRTIILEGEKTQLVLSADAAEAKVQQTKAIQTVLGSGVKLSEVAYVAPSAENIQKAKNILALMEGSPVNAEAPQAESKPETPKAEAKAPEAKAPEAKAPEAKAPEANGGDDSFFAEVFEKED